MKWSADYEEARVGEVEDPAGMAASHRRACRDMRFDGVEKANELLMAMTLHVATDGRPLEHIQGRQRGRAVALVVVGHGSGAAHLHRQSRETTHWIGRMLAKAGAFRMRTTKRRLDTRVLSLGHEAHPSSPRDRLWFRGAHHMRSFIEELLRGG